MAREKINPIENSRITAGDISIIVDQETVERRGFASLVRKQEMSSEEIAIVLEERLLVSNSFPIIPLGTPPKPDHTPSSLLDLYDMYLANATVQYHTKKKQII